MVDKTINKLTVLRNVDPLMLRDHVEAKTHKKVEISSLDSNDQKKLKLVASMVVLKIGLDCHCCSERIKKTIFKVKGVHKVSVDDQKDLVTVKGSMDVISLLMKLRDKLKYSVEIVSAKIVGGDMKEKAEDEKNDKGEDSGNGGKKEEDGGNGGGGSEEKKEGGGGGEKGEVAKVSVAEVILVCVVLYFVFVIIYSSR